MLMGIGFVVQRQQGSHVVLRRESPSGRVSVPDNKVLRLATLRTVLCEAGISVEQLVALRWLLSYLGKYPVFVRIFTPGTFGRITIL
jgi:predicted RNA binding protein YcfA (HicA-like mRNA interferase family)